MSEYSATDHIEAPIHDDRAMARMAARSDRRRLAALGLQPHGLASRCSLMKETVLGVFCSEVRRFLRRLRQSLL
jgi:hypothetical protein